MLDKIERDSLSDSLKSLFDETLSSLLDTPKLDFGAIGLTFRGDVNIEAYIHTNTKGLEKNIVSGDSTKDSSDNNNRSQLTEKAFRGEHDWIYKYKDQKPFLSLNTQIWAASSIYATADLTLQNSWHAGKKYEKDLGATAFQTNIIFLKNPTLGLDIGLFDGNWPNRAFLSFGGNNWNVMVGRDRLNWGAGKTGNLTISDNMARQDFLKFTMFSKGFKYTLLTSFYPYTGNFYDGDNWDALNIYNINKTKGFKMYIGHRFELRLLKDKLTLGVTDGLIYMSEDGSIDFRSLNPFNFNHNNYIKKDSNSTLEFEVDYTPIKGLNIYGQFIVDEITFFGEGKASATLLDSPSAFGWIVGVKGVLPTKLGLFDGQAEVAHTDPYLYLRGNDLDGTNVGDNRTYGIDYVVALRNWSSSTGATTYDEYCLGYTYGPDSIVWNLNMGWTSNNNKLKVSGNFFGMVHGTHDIWTRWQRIGGSEENYNANKSTPTPSHTPNNAKDSSATTTRDSASTTLVFGVNANYEIFKNFNVMTQLDFVTIKNYSNISSSPRQNDFQVVIGASYSF